ncbi:hypothetical protein ACFSJ3_17275 [Corallincola platygyrae]|uniref:Uncharacterized protein n=1 Tax=Corallincola platygyrae TaxID=1193278 RepID=A0ABW4XRL5_9GAMM
MYTYSALNAMDALEKLAAKNKAHQKQRRGERFLSAVMFLVLIPSILGIVVDLGFIESSSNFNLWLYGLGALGFGLLLAAMGDLMRIPRWLKICGLLVAQCWFVYFWTFQMQSWMAFLPLVPAYLVLQLRASIKEHSVEE